MRASDPTVADTAVITRGFGEVVRRNENLVRRLADIEDSGVATHIQSQLIELAQQRQDLGAESAAQERIRECWRLAQRWLVDLATWCATVAANLDELTYEQRRLALRALGATVSVYKTDGRQSNWEIKLATPMASTSRC